ncbi:MAG: replication-associated recombination protein A [Bdellovibrionales bacterium]
MDLFEYTNSNPSSEAHAPLAERLRPRSIDEFSFGSGKEERLLKSYVQRVEEKGRLPNVILWGPPGSGKTTLARIILSKVDAQVVAVNAISTGAKKLKELGEEARSRRAMYQQQTVIFIDEIHRLNKAQQDVLLPFTESGVLSLIGATTENPGYEINSALSSRCTILRLNRHDEESFLKLLSRVETQLGYSIQSRLEKDALKALIETADGDGRRFLNNIESIQSLLSQKPTDDLISLRQVLDVLPSEHTHYDKGGDEHYNCISAFIKSMRGSDPDASVYYLARMLIGGEDPKFIARRMIILASEDIGNADPRALPLAVSCFQAVENIGMPECRIVLAQTATYLAAAPKSNASYEAISLAYKEVQTSGSIEVPNALKSAKNAVAKRLGFGDDYRYSHAGQKGFVPQDFLPPPLVGKKFYHPKPRGFEKQIIDYLRWVRGESDD